MLERLRSGPIKYIAFPIVLLGLAFVVVRRFMGEGTRKRPRQLPPTGAWQGAIPIAGVAPCVFWSVADERWPAPGRGVRLNPCE